MRPIEYVRRNVYFTYINEPDAVQNREIIGVDNLMWASDYPHSEGTYPYTTEGLRVAFAGMDPAEVQRMVGTTAAEFYGFDVATLRPIADRIGPTVEAVAQPLSPGDYPVDSTCNAFEREPALKAW